MKFGPFGFSLLVLGMTVTAVQADLPQVGDVVFGLSRSNSDETIEMIRGPATSGGGAVVPDIWNATGFIQSLEFDNLSGIRHNANGNLLGVNFGTTATGGSIYSFSTTNAAVGAGQLIGDTVGLGGTLTKSRLGGLSVSPGNNRIAMVGSDQGTVVVYDYTAGDTMGAGASLSNARETAIGTVVMSTSGTTWLDNDTALAFSALGDLIEVDASVATSPMPWATVTSVVTPFVGSHFTSLAYNPDIAPYVYATYSGFNSGTMTTSNKLYVFDPASSYALVKEIDLSTSVNTLREIALGPGGVLYLGQFGGSSAPGAKIDILPNALNPASLTDNSSIDWYTPAHTLTSSFNGLDIATGQSAPVIDADFNDDGMFDCLDVDALVQEIVDGTNDPAFDLTADGNVDNVDLNQWLGDAGEENLGPGKSYLVGDATLSGAVDGSDFGVWNSNKFTSVAAWCQGDFNASGAVDGSDYGLWNANKFTSSLDAAAVPEPAAVGIVLLSLALLARGRR